MADKREEATVQVRSKGGEKEESKEPAVPAGPNPELTDDKKKDGPTLSPEDAALKERLDTAVARALEADVTPPLALAALGLLASEIRSATSSMTSVPKPFKFLAPHYAPLVAHYEAKTKAGTAAAGGAAVATAGAASSSATASSSNWTPELQRAWADLLSVLSMTMAAPGARACLKYRLAGTTTGTGVGEWGSEYVHTLAGEIGQEHTARTTADAAADVSDLLALARVIVPYDMAHNAEVDAVDLCVETASLRLLLEPGMVEDGPTLARVCNYLLKAADYLGDTDEAAEAASVVFELYLSHGHTVDAIRTALRAGGPHVEDRIKQAFKRVETGPVSSAGASASSVGGASSAAASSAAAAAAAPLPPAAVKVQMGHLLGRHKAMNFVAHDDAVDAAIGNASLSSLYQTLARDLDVTEPKGPEDIYKSHLTAGGGGGRRGAAGGAAGGAASGGGDAAAGGMESAKGNLASSYVSAFVNAGHGTDKLLTPADSNWVHRNREHGTMAAVAGLGLLHAWNEMQLDAADKYLSSDDDWVRAGGVLSLALMTAGTRNLDVDPIYGLLSSYLEEGTTAGFNTKMMALYGLGLVYAGSARADVAETVTGYLDGTADGARGSWELACIAALALGMIHVGSANELAASAIADRLMGASETDAAAAITRHLALGLALLFMSRGDSCDAILEILAAVEHPVAETAKMLVKGCAWAGTGNVLAIQEMLRVCAAHPEADDKAKAEKEEKERAEAQANAAAAAGAAASVGGGAGGNPAGTPAPGARPSAAAGAAAPAAGAAAAAAAAPDVAGKYLHQSAAVLGLSLIAIGDELSIDMATRMADHLLQYGDTAVRRVVPLSIAMLHIGDPDYGIVDILSKLTHDTHEETAQAAIIGLGLVAAGTNNSRVAGLLRTLSTFYKTEPGHLFVVRLAQGLLHMGKGLITVNPVHSDRSLLSPVALAGVLSAVLLWMDVKASLHATGAKWHFLLYSLVTAMYPRFVMAVDEAGKELQVEVRVGTAVETVGQAGRPKTITGFQTHTTPVLLGVRDRAELADAEAHTPLTSVLEGIVVLRANPGAGRAGKGGKSGSAAAGGAASGGAGAASKA